MSARNLAQLPSGVAVFVDANILTLAITGTGALSQWCQQFLDRTRSRELTGYTATIVVAEVIHRVIVAEARQHLGLSSRDTVQYLQRDPSLVQQLRGHLRVASDVRNLGLDILPLTVKDLHASKAARANHGLLANDSLIVGVMHNRKLRNLATHDSGFAQVPQLQVWMPNA